MSYLSKQKAVLGKAQKSAFEHQAKLIEKQARARASKALSNAKQRCTNQSNPDYASYGGKGIQMLFDNVAQLIAVIGLPKLGYSLDRIDPNGHYEPGNVRWTTPAVQAANKQGLLSNAHLTVDAQIAAAKENLAVQEGRKIAALSWVRALRAFNEGRLPLDHASWMVENLVCPGMLESNFDFDTVYDWKNLSPGYMHLPALSLPKARVRIRSGPMMHLPASASIQAMGRLGGLETLSPEWNVPPAVWAHACALVQASGSGLILHGRPTHEDLLGGWIEGCCLAMAGALSSQMQVESACYPMLRIHKMLGNLGPPENWDEEYHALLDSGCLLIPDFSLDCGAWGHASSTGWWKVGALLRYRHERRLMTVVGVQSLGKLPAPVRDIALGAFTILKMPHSKAHKQEEIEFCDTSYGVPFGCTTLREMKLDAALSRLVVHDGLLGT